MAMLRVFVSSTCYDLSVVRGQLRQFIVDQGHEPMMSDYNDVLYDPRSHTHTNCVDEVANADVVVVIIGARFGGSAIPQALQKVDFDLLETVSKNSDFLKTRKGISITQLEVLKAIEQSVPVFAFVDDRVLHDHATYERNKGKPISDQIEFSSIEKPETAKYIFEFINFLRHRSTNNGMTAFSRLEDLEQTLCKQWSALLQRLLFEHRSRLLEGRRIDALTDQFEDLKAAILTAIGGTRNEKEIARGVVRFRKLIDFIRAFDLSSYSFLLEAALDWDGLLLKLDVKAELELEFDARGERNSPLRPGRYLFVRSDDTFFEIDRIFNPQILREDWQAFMLLDAKSRGVVVEALSEMRLALSLRRYVRHVPKNINEYLASYSRQSALAGIHLASNGSLVPLVIESA